MNCHIVLLMIGLKEKAEMSTLLEKLKRTHPVEWNEDADPLLNDRYFIKDINGSVIENKEELIYRVATALSDEPHQIEKFYSMMASGMFLPNTPTLVNAQRPLGMLSACLVLPTGDSIEHWGKTVYDHMLMTKAGIGTGIDLSPIRQAGAMISSTKGEAGGAMGFLDLVNQSAKLVRQGSIRPSANMGTMRITHPELEQFIKSKASEIQKDENGNKVKVFEKLKHFNISITAFNKEFEALFSGKDIPIIEPHTEKIIGFRKGFEILDLIAKHVWDGGDPGLLNLTEANNNNPIVDFVNPITQERFGLKMVTNPCGEQWLYAYSVCNLGSINLSKFVHHGQFDYDAFAIYVEWAVEFLDAVIDANQFPVPEIQIMTQHLRNIGLGIMGWADTLLEMAIPYNTQQALDLAESIMIVFKQSANNMSINLATRNGIAPVFMGTDNIYRNYERTCIAPTGSISHIVGTSSGIEPNFTFAYTRNTSLRDGTKFFVVNPVLKRVLSYKKNPEGLLNEIIDNGGIISNEIAQKMELSPNYFKSTFDVTPEWHIRHQAIFQKYVDNAVSKTINVPEEFTKEEIKDAYKLSYELGCKGITIYRDKSRGYQILNSDKKENSNYAEAQTIFQERKISSKESQKGNQEINQESQESQEISNPKIFKSLNICCDYPNVVGDSGCEKCINCGWSICS